MVPRLQGEIAGLEAEQSTRWVWELLGVTTGATAASLVWCGAGGGCPEAVAWSLVGATVVQVGVWVFRLVTR